MVRLADAWVGDLEMSGFHRSAQAVAGGLRGTQLLPGATGGTAGTGAGDELWRKLPLDVCWYSPLPVHAWTGGITVGKGKGDFQEGGHVVLLRRNSYGEGVRSLHIHASGVSRGMLGVTPNLRVVGAQPVGAQQASVDLKLDP